MYKNLWIYTPMILAPRVIHVGTKSRKSFPFPVHLQYHHEFQLTVKGILKSDVNIVAITHPDSLLQSSPAFG